MSSRYSIVNEERKWKCLYVSAEGVACGKSSGRRWNIERHAATHMRDDGVTGEIVIIRNAETAPSSSSSGQASPNHVTGSNGPSPTLVTTTPYGAGSEQHTTAPISQSANSVFQIRTCSPRRQKDDENLALDPRAAAPPKSHGADTSAQRVPFYKTKTTSKDGLPQIRALKWLSAEGYQHFNSQYEQKMREWGLESTNRDSGTCVLLPADWKGL